MTSRATQTIFSTAPSIPKILRCVEWVSLAIPALRMLFPILYEPLGYEVSRGDFLAFGVLGLLAILSLRFPIDQPLWQRRVYIWVEIGALLVSRLYSDWGFDLLLWLVLAKGWFLLSRREAIFTTILAGVAWQGAIAQYFITRLSRPADLQAELEALQAIPLPVQIVDIVLNSTAIFIAANSLIIVLCLTVIAERKSRQREAALAREVEVLAADLERTRIARDIHDSLGHTLTSLDVQLELAQRLYERGSDQVRQALDTSKMLASQSVQEVRRAVATMRQESFDLNTALAGLIEPFKADPALTVESQIDLPRLPLPTSHQIYCIVKEGLENIRRHSQATSIRLWAKAIPEGILLDIADDGVGFDPFQPASGFGLRGMQERVQLMGGQITIDSTPGQGTILQIMVPR